MASRWNGSRSRRGSRSSAPATPDVDSMGITSGSSSSGLVRGWLTVDGHGALSLVAAADSGDEPSSVASVCGRT